MAQGQGKYLYAVIENGDEERFGPVGIKGAEVYTLAGGGVSAVVSDAPAGKLRPERRNLAAHHAVLKMLTERGAVLPVSFGTVADDPSVLRGFLKGNAETFKEQLRRVEGRVEMGLKIRWDVADFFEYFVHRHPPLAAARDRLFAGGGDPSHEERIELGRLFDRLLEEDRKALADRVEDILASRRFEVKRSPSRNEREVMNLACLVERDREQEFEETVFEAAKLFDDHFAIDYSGPWAPYNFVSIEGGF